jgi:hypothetical protein
VTTRIEFDALMAVAIAFTRHDGLQNAPAAPAQNVGQDRCHLDVGLIERRLDPLRLADDLARQLMPRADQIAQFLDGLRRHETRADQTVCEKVSDPGCIVVVALAAWQVAHVRGVGETVAIEVRAGASCFTIKIAPRSSRRTRSADA